ncbi:MULTISPECIES: protein-export chaperone SecB [Caballeronia]|jgi:preprotein translocase subunit SecB|uniref:Protein-export protein SecB n=3 Tax=Caballeronia TaxID=1827195 RepID=A0AA37MGF6_9BURK|nr:MULTISPECIES: protein-export chaperone SecB [Caballeronia]KAK49533.1 preprotein translocase subunit SecB [Caballeronia jiangsuensis]MBC8640278.1 protein-export chaperone SecB [Caballeronia sp. EK]MDR5741770.1 protein-export chaperone SecB [Caballeronia sp. LZ029]GJH07498.1 protein-export chaperone SecB [Caballeronia novacaledonica]GJH18655.1 protein-export chaperone SecB [Caballeronia novacaledonica]
MSDENNQPFFNIQRIYLKDMSLEQPNSPAIFLEQEMPSVEVEVDVKADRLAESVFEVLVTGTVTAKVAGKVAFLIEAKQAGIFDIRNIPADQIDPLVGIACPTILFPYLRSNIADAITRAGFPPIHLAEINFQALYEQRIAQLASAQEGAANGATH